MAERTQFHVWAGAGRVSSDAVNELFTSEQEARKFYGRMVQRHAYAELVRRDWNDAPLYVGRRWVSAGCSTGCCGWTLNTLESKGDAANYQDHKGSQIPGAVHRDKAPA